MQKASLSSKYFEVLKSVRSHDNPSYETLAEKIDQTEANVRSNVIPSLEQKGLVNVDRDSRPHSKQVTTEGMEIILDEKQGDRMSSESSVRGSGSGTFYHNFEMEFPVQNSEMLEDDWRERVIEVGEFHEKYFEDFDQYKFSFDQWRFRLTDDSVMVRLKDEFRGSSVREVTERSIERTIEGAKLLQEETPIVVGDSPASYRVVSHHIGKGEGSESIMHEFCRYIDEETEQNVSNFRVNDDTGELLIWADKSSGELQEESGNGGHPSGSREKAVSTQEYLEEISEFMVSNRGKTRDLLYRGPERINQLQRTVDEVKELGKELQGMQALVKQERKNREELQRTQEALMEQVRAVNKVAQQNQEVLERLVSIEEDRKQEEHDSIVDPLARELEISSKWEDCHGNIMGYCPELGKPVKVIDKENI